MKQRLFWSAILTLGLLYIAAPIYSGNLKDVLHINNKNSELRIDVISYGNQDNKAELLEATNLIKSEFPRWFKTNQSIGMFILLSISQNWQDYQLKIKTNNAKEIKIRLMGPDKRINNTRLPVIVDYDNFSINGENHFNQKQSFWYDNPYTISINAQEGIADIKFSARYHSMSWKDIISYASLSWILLFTVAVLGFSLAYSMITYFAKFQSRTKQSRIDTVFLTLFFAALFIPMSRISNEEKSPIENRILAKKPQLSEAFTPKVNYGTQFETWFNDRFFGRDALIKLYKYLDYNLASSYYITDKGCVNKKTKWIGSCESEKNLFTDEQLQTASKNINQLIEFANKNNIKAYVLIAPSLHSVYGEKIIPWYNYPNETKRVWQMASYIKDKNGVDIIYPHQKILDASSEDHMFFKTDTHWTDSGAFVAYQEVMNEVRKDFSDIYINTANDFNYFYSNKVKVKQDEGLHNGRNYNLIGLNDDRFFDVKYKYFTHHDAAKIKQETFPNSKEQYIITKFLHNAGKYNLTLFGDSFGENLQPIIPYSFKNTFKIYTWAAGAETLSSRMNIKRFEKDIANNKTDVLIICLSKIDRLMYLYKD